MNEIISAEENPSDGELSKDADLQEAYNKLAKLLQRMSQNVTRMETSLLSQLLL